MLFPLQIFLSILFFRKDEDTVKEPPPEPLNLAPLHSHLACEGRKTEVQGGRCFATFVASGVAESLAKTDQAA